MISGDTASSDSLVTKLLNGRRHKLKKGEVFQTTDGRRVLNLVKSGYAKRYMISNNGNLSVQIVYGPGDIFPITLVYETLFGQNMYEGPEVFYYEAISPMVVYTIDDLEILDTAKRDPTIYIPLLKESGKRLHSTLNGLENIGLPSSYHRVGHQILYLAKQFGKEVSNDQVKIPINLTHQDLADILSVTRETVSLAMVKLRDKKLIKYNAHITVLSMSKLEEETYSS